MLLVCTPAGLRVAKGQLQRGICPAISGVGLVKGDPETEVYLMVLNLIENGIQLKHPAPSLWSSHLDQQEKSYQDK